MHRLTIKLIALLMVLSATQLLQAQDRLTYRDLVRSDKLNPSLKRVIADHYTQAEKPVDAPIRMLIQADPNQVDALASQAGASIQSRAGDVFSVMLPINRIVDLVRHQAFRRAEFFPSNRATVSTDSAAIHTNVPPVWNGNSPLTQSYTGKGVIVGIIDSGVDYQHGAFKRKNDTKATRILRFWDQLSVAGVAPLGYVTGAEWTEQQINDELADNPAGVIDHQDEVAHGTHVGAIAAGNIGIAKGADMMYVAVDLQGAAPINDIFSSILDGATYIYREAKLMDRPCVINASLGIPILPLDGNTLLEQGIKNLVTARPGRVFVAACGNSGQNTNHWGGQDLTSTESWVYMSADILTLLLSSFQGTPPPTEYAFSMTIPDSVMATTELKFVADSAAPAPGGLLGLVTAVEPVASTDSTEWMTGTQLLSAGDTTLTLNHTDGSFAGRIRLTSSMNATGEYLQIEGTLRDSATVELVGFTTNIEGVDMYRVKTRGTGSLDAISGDQSGMTFISDTANAYGANYVDPDNLFTISVPSSGTHVLGVGSYCNRVVNPGGGGNPLLGGGNAPYPQGTLSNFSSRGPTTDGRIKPDIIAPGENVGSAHSQYATQQQPAGSGDYGEIAYQSGTSMSAPVVAGIVALMMQRDQDINWDQVHDIIKNTAAEDFDTESNGPLPNPHWGWGKIDAFDAVKTAEDDPIQVGLPEEALQLNASLYPNPTTGALNILLPPDAVRDSRYSVVTLSGQTLLEGAATGSSFSLDLRALPAGVYIVKLEAGSAHTVQRIIKQ